MDKDLVFIVSAGRTGTTFLGNMLSVAIENCHSEHEPDDLTFSLKKNIDRIRKYGSWYMVIGRLLGISGVRPLGQKYVSGRVSEEQCLSEIVDLRRRLHSRIKESLVVESNGQWNYLVGLIHKVWPKAKIIVIVRDPRTWVQSWMNRGIRYSPYDPVRFFPPGWLSPSKVGDLEWENAWSSFDTFGRLVWEWRNVNGRLLDYAESDARCHLFRYEDLFKANCGEAMRDLVEFAAIHGKRQYRFSIPEGFTSEKHHASSGDFPHWREWDMKRAQLLDRLCGQLMHRFHYGTESQWHKMI